MKSSVMVLKLWHPSIPILLYIVVLLSIHILLFRLLLHPLWQSGYPSLWRRKGSTEINAMVQMTSGQASKLIEEPVVFVLCVEKNGDASMFVGLQFSCTLFRRC
jgi:hypothetical protein